MPDLSATTHERWLRHFEDIDLEIAREAIVCAVPLLDPGVIERVLDGDGAVCGHLNPAAFDKLRALLIMHFSVRQRAVQALGEAEMRAIGQAIRQHLRARIGSQWAALRLLQGP